MVIKTKLKNIGAFVERQTPFCLAEREIFWSVLDSNGTIVVQYWYDAWGNHKVCDVSGNEITDTAHIGHMNAYRYRGYYYDRETGLYYLNTRYYDPETGRWLNKDDVLVTACLGSSKINGLNSYAYCFNNPVMYVDYGGLFPKLWREIHEKNTAKEHIHVKYKGKDYSWYREGHKNRHRSDLGLKDLPSKVVEKLKELGVPKDYFNTMLFNDYRISDILAFPMMEQTIVIVIDVILEKGKEDNLIQDPVTPPIGGSIIDPVLPPKKPYIESFPSNSSIVAGLTFMEILALFGCLALTCAVI